jgi:hypothetical protein
MTVFVTASIVAVLLGFKLWSAQQAHGPAEAREPASPVEA